MHACRQTDRQRQTHLQHKRTYNACRRRLKKCACSHIWRCSNLISTPLLDHQSNILFIIPRKPFLAMSKALMIIVLFKHEEFWFDGNGKLDSPPSNKKCFGQGRCRFPPWDLVLNAYLIPYLDKSLWMVLFLVVVVVVVGPSIIYLAKISSKHTLKTLD